MDTNIKVYAVDNDDVLFPVGQSFCCDFNNHFYGTNKELDDFYSYEAATILGISWLEWWKREREYYGSDFYMNMKPDAGAHGALEYLSNRGEVHLVTGRGKDVEHHTKHMLEKHFAPHHFKGVHHSGPHTHNGHREKKWEICKRIGAKTLFDDFHSTLIDAAEHGINGVLFIQPWNKYIINLPKNIHRVRNWNEAIEVVEKFNL